MNRMDEMFASVKKRHLTFNMLQCRVGQISVAHLAILRLSSVLARLHGTLLIP